VHDGVNIIGAGGIITDPERLLAAIFLATGGHPLGTIFSPKPGHVRGCYATWWGKAEERDVDLRGAELIRWSNEPLPDIPPPADYDTAPPA
jgi:hypothetical protein